jgi:hypothetical protein
LALYGADGTTLRVPDSAENSAHFGHASSGTRGESGYPIVRMVAVMALRSHVVANACFGPYKKGEHALASELWEGIPDDSLTIIDKNFLSAQLLLSLQTNGTNRHWLIPAKVDTKWRQLKCFAKGDELVEMNVSREAKRKDPSLPKPGPPERFAISEKAFGHEYC